MKIVSCLSLASLIALCGATQLHANESDDDTASRSSGVSPRSSSSGETISPQQPPARKYRLPRYGDPRLKKLMEETEPYPELSEFVVPRNPKSKGV